jgi:hypothetical protein
LIEDVKVGDLVRFHYTDKEDSIWGKVMAFGFFNRTDKKAIFVRTQTGNLVIRPEDVLEVYITPEEVHFT